MRLLHGVYSWRLETAFFDLGSYLLAVCDSSTSSRQRDDSMACMMLPACSFPWPF